MPLFPEFTLKRACAQAQHGGYVFQSGGIVGLLGHHQLLHLARQPALLPQLVHFFGAELPHVFVQEGIGRHQRQGRRSRRKDQAVFRLSEPNLPELTPEKRLVRSGNPVLKMGFLGLHGPPAEVARQGKRQAHGVFSRQAGGLGADLPPAGSGPVLNRDGAVAAYFHGIGKHVSHQREKIFQTPPGRQQVLPAAGDGGNPAQYRESDLFAEL